MKKFFKSILIISMGMGLFTSCVIRQSPNATEAPRTISVEGKGSVSVKPDLIYLKFLVRTTDWNVSKAVEKNATNTGNVLKALTDAGLASSDISTYDYTITQDNSNNYPGQYTVKNTIAVVIRNIETAGSIIDAAVKINTGANGITEFKYGISDKSPYLRQARTLAIQDALDAASLLAGASGCKVSSVLNINEYNSSWSGNAYNDVVMLKSSGENGTQIQEGNITITSNVNITYKLEN